MTWHRGLWLPTVGVAGLGGALNRTSAMIHRLEEMKILPSTPIREPIPEYCGAVGHDGARRYTIDMVLEAQAAAIACGVLDRKPSAWADTRFADLVATAWEQRLNEIDAMVHARNATYML